MRQVFSSARLENVEQVAKLLEDAGIEVRITNGRSYRGTIRGNFSYRQQAGQQQAAVWIVNSADQPRARAMLREAGLMDSSRNAADSPVAISFRGDPAAGADLAAGKRRALRIRMGLIVVIAVILMLAFMTRRAPPPAASPESTAATTPAAAPAPALAKKPDDLPGLGTTATPDSLAAALLRGELPENAGDIACIAVDGGDASSTLLASLPPTPGRVLPLSRCPASAGAGQPAPRILAIGKYVANEAGTGTIYLQRRRVGGRAVPQWYEVRRHEGGWRVVQPL